MCLAGKTIVVGTLDKGLHGFSLKGKRSWAHVLPSALQTLSNLDDRDGGQLFLASLSNGDVRLYKDKQVLSTMKVPGGDMATAMRFGKYAREEGTLLIVHQSGALGVKILSRKSDLSKTSEVAGPPPEQDVPLNVPKKTKLYVEQVSPHPSAQYIILDEMRPHIDQVIILDEMRPHIDQVHRAAQCIAPSAASRPSSSPSSS